MVQDEMGIEIVFKGDAFVNQFITWLLDGIFEGVIVIVYNLRGCDGYDL